MFNEKIIWPVNVLDDKNLQVNALYLLGELTRSTGAQVQPVTILNPPRGNLEPRRKDFHDAFRALAEKRLQEINAACDIEKMEEGKIIEGQGTSVKGDVKLLLDYAKTENAGAIVLSTHARGAVPRFFLGSFAETLMLNSTIPVFTVNPQAKVRERIANILFPTVVDPDDGASFGQVLQLAKASDAKVTIYYKEPLLLSPYMSAEFYAFLDEEAVARAKDAKKWQEMGRKEGVEVDLHFDNQAGYVPSAITKYAEQANVDLIAMCSRATQWSSVLLGSTTRQVIREATCPVWVVRNLET